ncbi:MAG: hypothetical protein HY597_01090 [Candidatus Omnitrophica bacterium]|nr:hypothetical protein [Candidatus Omnitrophota bacterium]
MSLVWQRAWATSWLQRWTRPPGGLGRLPEESVAVRTWRAAWQTMTRWWRVQGERSWCVAWWRRQRLEWSAAATTAAASWSLGILLGYGVTCWILHRAPTPLEWVGLTVVCSLGLVGWGISLSWRTLVQDSWVARHAFQRSGNGFPHGER